MIPFVGIIIAGLQAIYASLNLTIFILLSVIILGLFVVMIISAVQAYKAFNKSYLLSWYSDRRAQTNKKPMVQISSKTNTTAVTTGSQKVWVRIPSSPPVYINFQLITFLSGPATYCPTCLI